MKKITSKITALMLSLIMILGCIPNIANAETVKSLDNFVKVQDYHEGMFNDVKPDDWYHENVSSVYEINLMIGREHDMFDAEENMTVAEAFTIAARLNSIYYTGKADFIQGELWYEVYTEYCKENKIADPSKYDLEKPITRGEFAEIFSKALPEEVLEEINKIKDGAIPDVKMNDAFSAAIYMLYRVGILTGIDEAGYFNSNSNIQRMEAAAITTRMVKPSLRKSVTLDDTKNKTQYTVTFNLVYNGETFDSVKVLDGEKVERPSNPTRSKYKFNGWYDKEEGGTKFDFDTEITTNIVLFAHWKKKSSGSSLPPEPTFTTVGDILATVDGEFPRAEFDGWMELEEIPEDAWLNENSTYFACVSNAWGEDYLFVVCNNPELLFKYDNIPLSATVTKNGNIYTAEHPILDFQTFHFTMSGGKLTSLSLESGDEYAGTYSPESSSPAPLTIAAVLATAENNAPNADFNWDGQDGYTCGIESGTLLSFANPTKTSFVTITTSKFVTDAGDGNYTYELNDDPYNRLYTFNMTSGVVTSITLVCGGFESEFSGTYSIHLVP